MQTRVTILTLGCKTNQAESESLGLKLSENGYLLVAPGEQADICILNTCTVTSEADRKCRQMLRRIRLEHPGALLVARGCYARRAPTEVRRTTDVNVVAAADDEEAILEMLRQASPTPPFLAKKRRPTRTRSFVKIQEGCDSHCTYCIVPSVRGVPASREVRDVVREVQKRIALGYPEIVLTGTNVGCYQSGQFLLGDLLREVLEITGVRRVRLSSLQPTDIGEALLEAWRDPRMCRHFHLPLQSGSATVLRRMGRRYSLEEYVRAISWLRERLPDAAVTTDVVVGFPSESEAEYMESYDFCSEMAYAAIHVFPYSPRPGTGAALMRPTVEAR
ncbi:MAG: MiaB/RimO family radical SAM methylthiotransferase, partial [Chloroflexi bacterium]|nr:MiaB/RimO family radical SAM methylthiotransferase [Chloroflexota bacterium]